MDDSSCHIPGDGAPSLSGTAAITFQQVTKSFGATQALRGLDLTVAAGQIHGFLGPNGAGKSTALRIALGLLRASGGTVSVLGSDPWQAAAALHRRLAYVPGDVALWPGLTGGEAIDTLLALHGGGSPGRRSSLLEAFQLDPTRRCRTYSKGNRQKVALVAALACNADLLILDEPTSGLDPLMEAVFQDHIRQRAAQGATVLLSSHILAEVEALCGWVTIIRDGLTVRTGSLESIRSLGRSRVIATTLRTAAADLNSLAGVAQLTTHGSRVEFTVTAAGLDAAINTLAHTGLTALTCQPPSLEEIFLGHYGAREAAQL